MIHDLKKRVLILEDEEIVRLIINDFLKMTGFDVYESDNATSALQLLEKECIDISIVDINIPGISGEDFIVAAKRICPELQCIIHTGETDYKVSERLQKLGITQNSVLVKPVEDMYVFRTTIDRLLATKSLKERT
ncbi:MAG: response regulator [Candidatus Magnetomorum sp.]|nr:response regulator [Candidatus Magnetomorum sp.]